MDNKKNATLSASSTQENALSLNRQPYWSEIDDKEKIERIRAYIKNLEYSFNDIKQEIREIKQHKHDKDGIAIIEKRLIDSYPNFSTIASFGNSTANKDEVYI